MAKKATVKDLKQKAGRLLDIAPLVDEYERLRDEIKAGMQELKLKQLQVEQGEVLVSVTTRISVPPALAISELGADLAMKVIQVKRTVSNEILKAFVKAGEISEEQRERLYAGAEQTPVVSLTTRRGDK